jgi:hypothetical protein
VEAGSLQAVEIHARSREAGSTTRRTKGNGRNMIRLECHVPALWKNKIAQRNEEADGLLQSKATAS